MVFTLYACEIENINGHLSTRAPLVDKQNAVSLSVIFPLDVPKLEGWDMRKTKDILEVMSLISTDEKLQRSFLAEK